MKENWMNKKNEWMRKVNEMKEHKEKITTLFAPIVLVTQNIHLLWFNRILGTIHGGWVHIVEFKCINQ